MSADALAAAFEAALPAVKVYQDRVPKDPKFPYVFVLTNFPSVAGRAVNRKAQFSHLRARTTVTGITASSVRITAQALTDALEGKHLVVPGWQLGAIESVPNDQPMLRDMGVTIPGSAENPIYRPFDWVVTGSEI